MNCILIQSRQEALAQGAAAMPANVMFVNLLFVVVAAIAASRRFPGR